MTLPAGERREQGAARRSPAQPLVVALRGVAVAACVVADWCRAREPALRRAGRRLRAGGARGWGWARRKWPLLRRAAVVVALVLEAAAVAVSGWVRAYWPVVRRAVGAALRAVGRWVRGHWPAVRRGTVLAAELVAETARDGWHRAALRWPGVRRRLVTAAAVTGLGARVAAHAGARGAAAGARVGAHGTAAGGRAAAGMARAALAARPRRPPPLGPRYHVGTRRRPAALVGSVAALSVLTATAVAGSAAAAVPVIRFALANVRRAVSTNPLPVSLPSLPQRSVVFAADGAPTAVLYGAQDRQAVPLSQVAPIAVAAVLDTEDDRFWSHGGVDPHAVVRALVRDVRSGGTQQGGSTLAQQLVKNTLLTSRRDFRRKVTEMVLADRIERRYGKRAVLERYLNTVYFGEGAYGIESAAETYFGTTAAALTPAHAALLAGLIHDPSGEDPLRHKAAARARRHLVLGLLLAHHHLGVAQAAAADRTPLPGAVNRPPPGRDYFTDAVRRELLGDRRLGATVAERERALLTGGLKIHTTLDRRLQQEAGSSVAGGLPQAQMTLSAALAAVDPATGAVRAVIGGPSYSDSQFDAAVAGSGRQPGSSFKVFTLVAALEEGHSPNDIIDGSSPCTIPNPGGTPNPWTPANFEGEAFGPISLTTATALSVNCAYARLALVVGLPRIAQVAHEMGITTSLASVPSMTLGTNDVTPLQMASAYATLADDGVYHRPHLVQEVDRSDGKVLFHNADPGRQAIPVQVAREATQVLQQVVAAGTGRAANLPGRQVAGKTGTTEHYQDAWFVGYAPQLATALWMGDPKAEAPMLGVGGINVYGGSFPAQMWHTFMSQALAPLPPAGFTPPAAGAVPPPSNLATPGGSTPSSGHTRVTTWCWSSCGH